MNKVLTFFNKLGKPAGIFTIGLGIVSYYYKLQVTGIADWVGSSKIIAFGCILFFFSKEKQVDERILQLKFYAIALSFLVSYFVVDLFNYLMLNFSSYDFDTDVWSSVTAYDFIITCMVMAAIIYYIMRYKDAAIKEA